MNPPAVSVLIVNRDYSDTAPRAIRSALSQTFTDLEVVFLDYGSRKPVPRSELTALRADPRFIYIQEQKPCVQTARNAAFARSRGRFVVYVDADAALHPDYLEKMLAALMDNPDAAYSYCRFRNHFPDGQVKNMECRPFERWALEHFGWISAVSLIRRECWVPFDPQIKRFQDWDVFIGIYEQHGRGGAFVPEFLFEHYMGMKKNVTVSADLSESAEAVKKKHEFFFLKNRVEDLSVDIIIPFFNQPEITIACLRSLRDGARSAYRVILVDNGSGAAESERVRTYSQSMPSKFIRLEENLGFVKAVNRALIVPRTGQYTVLLNNDVIVSAGWLERLRAIADANPRLGILGPVCENAPIPPTSSYDKQWQSIEKIQQRHGISYPQPPLVDADTRLEAINEFADEVYELHGDTVLPAGMVAFYAVLIKNEVIDQCGPLDEDFGDGLGDDDMYCALAKRAGWDIAAALGVWVYHAHRTTFRARHGENGWLGSQDKNLALLREKQKALNG